MGSLLWSLICFGVALNLVLGTLIGGLRLPIYLDSLGTVLVGALAGPGPAMLAGGCGVALMGVVAPTALAFLPVGLLIGLTAGVSARLGAFKSKWLVGLGGMATGLLGAGLSAPISAYVFGGVTGGGTDLIVALFRAGGFSAWQASFFQSLMVDSLDKIVTYLLVFGMILTLPRRTLLAFPMAKLLPISLANTPAPRQSYRRQKIEHTIPVSLDIGSLQARTGSALTQNSIPEAPVALKLLVVLSFWIAALTLSNPLLLGVILLALSVMYLVLDPALVIRTWRALALLLCPLSVSITLIQGLVVKPVGEKPWLLWGLAWSPSGLEAATVFVCRIGLLLVTLSFFGQLTSMQRLIDTLLRMRLPYPLLFVFQTGFGMACRFKQAWQIVLEAQQSRGLALQNRGFWSRSRALVGFLYPTLGVIFGELPQRAACLESRGLLVKGRREPLPLSWTKEKPPCLKGVLFYLLQIALAWSAVCWTLS